MTSQRYLEDNCCLEMMSDNLQRKLLRGRWVVFGYYKQYYVEGVEKMICGSGVGVRSCQCNISGDQMPATIVFGGIHCRCCLHESIPEILGPPDAIRKDWHLLGSTIRPICKQNPQSRKSGLSDYRVGHESYNADIEPTVQDLNGLPRV